MPAQRREVHADAPEHTEGAVETVAGIALGEELRDVGAAFIAQRRLDRLTPTDDGGAVGLSEESSSSSVFISTKELRIHCSKDSARLVIGLPSGPKYTSG